MRSAALILAVRAAVSGDGSPKRRWMAASSRCSTAGYSPPSSALNGEIRSPITYSGASCSITASRADGADLRRAACRRSPPPPACAGRPRRHARPTVWPFQRATRARPWAMSSISMSSGEGSSRSSRRPDSIRCQARGGVSLFRHGQSVRRSCASFADSLAPVSPRRPLPASRSAPSREASASSVASPAMIGVPASMASLARSRRTSASAGAAGATSRASRAACRRR